MSRCYGLIENKITLTECEVYVSVYVCHATATYAISTTKHLKSKQKYAPLLSSQGRLFWF